MRHGIGWIRPNSVSRRSQAFGYLHAAQHRPPILISLAVLILYVTRLLLLTGQCCSTRSRKICPCPTLSSPAMSSQCVFSFSCNSKKSFDTELVETVKTTKTAVFRRRLLVLCFIFSFGHRAPVYRRAQYTSPYYYACKSHWRYFDFEDLIVVAVCSAF